MASRVGLVAMLALVAAGDRDEHGRPPAAGGDGDVRRAHDTGCVRARCAAVTGSRSRTARARGVDGLRDPRCYVARAIDVQRVSLLGGHPGGVARSRRNGAGARRARRPARRRGGTSHRRDEQRSRRLLPRLRHRDPLRAGAVLLRRATQVNGSTRTPVSGVDLAAAGAARERRPPRAQAALHTKSGLVARGRFVASPDGGRVFKALRLYLRAPQPRA